MKSLLAIAIVFAAGAVSTISIRSTPADPVAQVRATDGAFRDGAYLGRLDAKQGQAAHVATGRWVSVSDRQAFAEGYDHGYTLASSKGRGAGRIQLASASVL